MQQPTIGPFTGSRSHGLHRMRCLQSAKEKSTECDVVEISPWRDVAWGRHVRSSNRPRSEPPHRTIIETPSKSCDADEELSSIDDGAQKNGDEEGAQSVGEDRSSDEEYLVISSDQSKTRRGAKFTSLDSTTSTEFCDALSMSDDLSDAGDESDNESVSSIARTLSPDAGYYAPKEPRSLPPASVLLAQPPQDDASPEETQHPSQCLGGMMVSSLAPLCDEADGRRVQQTPPSDSASVSQQQLQACVVYVPVPVAVPIQQSMPKASNANSAFGPDVALQWRLSKRVPYYTDMATRVPVVEPYSRAMTMDASERVHQVELGMEDAFGPELGFTRSLTEPANVPKLVQAEVASGGTLGGPFLSTVPPAYPPPPCPYPSSRWQCPLSTRQFSNPGNMGKKKDEGSMWARQLHSRKAVQCDPFGSEMPPQCKWSFGSVGHPFQCAAACKYATKGKCKDGPQCDHCHMCVWSPAQRKHHYVPQRRMPPKYGCQQPNHR